MANHAVVTAAFLAKKKGVSRSAVSHAAEPGGGLHGARVARGRFDQNHPGCKAWLASGAEPPTRPPKERRRGRSGPTDSTKSSKTKRREPTTDRPASTFSEREDAASAELRVKRERARSLWLKNEQLEKTLIPWELVRQFVLAELDATNKRLLGDGAKAIVQRLAPMARGGASTEELERVVVGIISGQLKRLKETSLGVLEGKRI